jgi:hypothetical protein
MRQNCYDENTIFYIAYFSNHYLHELVYWTFEKAVAKEMAYIICDTNGGPHSNVRGFEYGYDSLIELQKDINNDATNTILGFECKPNHSKCEIANRFHNKNFPNVNRDCLRLWAPYWYEFEQLCKRHNSIILAVLHLAICIEREI